MAIDLPPPRNVLVHGHWTMNEKKMSKSTGNVVNPFYAIDRFGVDGMRFFLAYQGGFSDDASYDNSFITRDYKKWLQNGLGNLMNRMTGLAKGQMPQYVEDSLANRGQIKQPEDLEHEEMLVRAPAKVAEHMSALDPRAALQEIVSIISRVWMINSRAPNTNANISSDQQVLSCSRAVEQVR